MKKVAAVLLIVCGSAGSLAQTGYTFEMRLVANGEAGAPVPGPSYPYNFEYYPVASGPLGGLSRIGFWLQARVAQTVGENWGIVRATSPAGGVSSITAAGFGTVALSRGHVGQTGAAPDTAAYGRGWGYRNGGAATGNTGNAGDSQPFPGTRGNENGGLDNGGSGSLVDRIYGFDSWVGSVRPGSGDESDNPWGVNGNFPTAPFPSDGTFSPWANLYHFWVDLLNWPAPQPGQMPLVGVQVTASAYLVAADHVAATDQSYSAWQMHEGPGRAMTATWGIPTPAAGSLLLMSAGFAARRRRG